MITTQIFQESTSHTQQNFSISQNFIPTKFFPYPQNFSILIPTKFCHKLHMPTNLPHSSWFCSTKPTQQIFHNFKAPKIQAKVHPTNITNYQHWQNFTVSKLPKLKPKFVQQHHKLPTLPKFHKPPTLSKLYHNQKIQHLKNAPKPTLQHDQLYNAPNSNKITQ